MSPSNKNINELNSVILSCKDNNYFNSLKKNDNEIKNSLLKNDASMNLCVISQDGDKNLDISETISTNEDFADFEIIDLPFILPVNDGSNYKDNNQANEKPDHALKACNQSTNSLLDYMTFGGWAKWWKGD